MAVDPAALKQFALYRDLSEPVLAALAGIGARRTYPRGHRLWAHSDPATGYYSVISGLIKSYREGPDGQEQMLCLLGPGQQAGAMAVLSEGRYPCAAATLDACELIYFPKDQFQRVVAEHHELALRLLQGLASQCDVLAGRVEDIALRDASGRLAHYLLSLAPHSTDDEGFPVVALPLSKTALSSLLGLSRETLSRTFAQLESSGLLGLAGREITLRDLDKLEELELGRSNVVLGR